MATTALGIYYPGPGENNYPANAVLQQMAESIDGTFNPSWIALTPVAGWTIDAAGAFYRLVNGHVELRGRADWGSAIPANQLFDNIPITRTYSGMAPCVTSASATGGTIGSTALSLTTAGDLIVRGSANQRWLQLDGLRIPLN